jgi:hypothetical protein
MAERCEECIWTNEQTGCCTIDDDCIDGGKFEQKTPQLGPEEMFKVVYMLIYSLGGEISIPKESFDKFKNDMKVLPSWDEKAKRFVLETSHKPKDKRKEPKLILTGGKLSLPRKKLAIPGIN